MDTRSHSSRKKFISYVDHAMQRLIASGLLPEQIERMREYGLMAKDNVTGFHEARSGKARLWTLTEAIQHAMETGESVYYLEMDLRNLGGLNARLGHTQANEVYAAIASIVQTELAAIASEAVFFRHGGDETCAFLINTTASAAFAAFGRVHRRVHRLAVQRGIHDIPHPKHPGDKNQEGTGVHFGMICLDEQHRNDPTLVFRQADVELESNKATRLAHASAQPRRKSADQATNRHRNASTSDSINSLAWGGANQRKNRRSSNPPPSNGGPHK